MAIYHFSVNIISRSSGRNATAAAAYRSAEKILDKETGLIHDYTRKQGVDEKFILAPSYAPDWVKNRETLWNEVEKVERRKNSQVAREINVALPTELNKNQQVELVKEFVTKQFVNQGMVADVAFHDLDSHNPHAHIMLTMRDIDEQGFSLKKNRDWNRRELLDSQRKAWANYTNLALEQADIDARIDHRSLEAQGINRLPQIHLGNAVNAMMKRGIVTERGERWLDIELANRQIATLEHSIEAELTTHTLSLSDEDITPVVPRALAETSFLQQKVVKVAPQLARLLNALNTYEINGSLYDIRYEPELKLLSFHDKTDPQQQFLAACHQDHWLARSGNLTEEKAVEILHTISRNLEILAEIKRQRERQIDIDLEY